MIFAQNDLQTLWHVSWMKTKNKVNLVAGLPTSIYICFFQKISKPRGQWKFDLESEK